MSFRIDLVEKDGVMLTLVIVRNQINTLFTPINDSTSELTSAHIRENFIHLSEHFPLDHYAPMVRGEDAEHIKRHHGSSTEVNVNHNHVSFDRDVTPAMLEEYLNGIQKGQKDHETEARYQFITKSIATHVLSSFTSFYNEFHNSALEKQFLEERQLTKSEKESLVRHARGEVRGVLTSADKKELELCGIDTRDITPKPRRVITGVPLEIQGLLRLMLLGGVMNSLSRTGNPFATSTTSTTSTMLDYDSDDEVTPGINM